MQSTVVMFARKPMPRSPFRRARRTRHGLLARLRDDITIMRTIGFDHATIGEALRISAEDARALSPKTNKPSAPHRLKRHAIDALLHGRHARLGGKTVAMRAKNLMKIAAAYSWEELLEEPGVGNVTATEIQLWLEARGVSLRTAPSPVSISAD